MEVNEGSVRQGSEGSGSTAATTDATILAVPGQGVEQPQEQSAQLVPTVPPELQPDKDGNPPNITPELIRQLRGKYFTVKHVRLTDCGHLLDMVNFPKRNCHTCLFNWFNSHAQLVELAHEFYQKHGKKALAAMRGDKFVKAFLMFMSTIAQFQKEAKGEVNGDNQEGSISDGTEAGNGQDPVGAADQRGEVEGGGVSN